MRAVTSKRRLARVRDDTLEDRAAAIGALNRGDDLPGLFVREADAQLALDFRDHVAVDLVGGTAAILDDTGIVPSGIETECSGGTGNRNERCTDARRRR